MLAVSRSYLDGAVGHHLALSFENGKAPPLGLLQVAEAIGGADWQPSRMAFGELLAALIAEVPKGMCEPAALASVLRRSDELAGSEAVAQSSERWSAHAAVTVRSSPPICCKASWRDIATGGLRSF